MTAPLPAPPAPPVPPAPDAQVPEPALPLRPTPQLARVPEPPPEPTPAAAPAAAAQQPPVVTQPPLPSSPMAANAFPYLPIQDALERQRANAPTWMAGSVAVLATLGWIMERRRRRLTEMEKDSVLWADVQPATASSIITTAGSLDDILPDGPDPAEAARAIYVTGIGETNSRREATLIDLHQLAGKLQRRRDRGDNVAAVLLLQQHLVDFRYTSPWVFLELRELYKVLDRPNEWYTACDAFRKRFGQNPPGWEADSHEDAALVDDAQLATEVSRYWPYRETRMFVIRWMLGDPEMRQRCAGPALLPLGIYRELMLLDTVLDDVMVIRPKPADSLL